jgi:oligopeptidase B
VAEVDSAPRPPKAKKVLERLAAHGDVRTDPYYWVRDHSDPDVIAYVQAENEYAKAAMAHLAGLREKVRSEIVARMSDDEPMPPVDRNGFLYQSRTVPGKQYRRHTRRMADAASDEELVLDENEVAEGHEFFSIGAVKPSPDNTKLAFAADTDGSERMDLRVKDLESGVFLEDVLHNLDTFEWTNDGSAIYYIIFDETHRPHKVLRHVLGTDAGKDQVVYHEEDARHEYMVLSRSKTDDFIILATSSMTTSEVLYVDADVPDDEFKVLHPRKHGVRYYAVHAGDRFYIASNEDAENYELFEAPDTDPRRENWKTVLHHRKDVAISVSEPIPWIEVFEGHLAIFERRGGLCGIRIMVRTTGEEHSVALPEELSWVTPWENTRFKTDKLKFTYSSMQTPKTVFEYDMRKRTLTELRKDAIPGYDPSAYEASRLFARAMDGAMIPVFVLMRKGTALDGSSPMLLYGYGSYGDFEGPAPEFDPDALSLVDRGFIYARAQIRGGGDMGGAWHKQGAMLNKVATFSDFIAVAEHLTRNGYTSRERLTIRGRSAGGLLMGAVTNMRPDLFRAVVAEVPFVDVVTTQLDHTIPLVPGECEEFGDPSIEDQYWYMKAYSPYDCTSRKEYPRMLVTAGMNDPRVPYWEPVKWVAKMRDLKLDDNLLLLVTGIVQGHSGASGRYDHAGETALWMTFLLDSVGIRE